MYNNLKEVEMEIDKIFRESNDSTNTVDNKIIQNQMSIVPGMSSIDDTYTVNNIIDNQMSSIILKENEIDDLDGLIQFLKDGKKKMEELWKISGEDGAIKLINDRCINFRDFKITAEHYKEINKNQPIDNDMGILGTLADKISVDLLADINGLMKMAIKKDASTDIDFYSFGFIRRVAKVWDQVKDKI
jgi:hypothetical protein